MIKNLSGQISDKDIPVLASAITGRADYFVTGDKRDFSKSKTEGKYPFTILSPSEFFEVILPTILKEMGQK